jgi:hypothetical protein
VKGGELISDQDTGLIRYYTEIEKVACSLAIEASKEPVSLTYGLFIFIPKQYVSLVSVCIVANI